MSLLARRNLFHDKVRLTVTITGVVFAVVLVAIQLGLYVGFSSSATDLITHSGADIWIVSKGVPYLEQGIPFSGRKVYQVRATPGVAKADNYFVNWGQWKRPDGRCESVEVVGFDIESGLGGPWNIVAGKIEDLRLPDTVMVDGFYFKKLGITGIGDSVEVGGKRARVIGSTRDIRTFTTLPYVFTSFKNGSAYATTFGNIRDEQTVYILVKAKPGVALAELQQSLQERLTDVDVLTTGEFTAMTKRYWLITTGAGMAVLVAAALGVLVGGVVVAQTIYSATIDHISEFGTLKAIGASNGYIYKVIIYQAVMSALLGYGLGMCLVSFIVSQINRTGANVLIPWPLAVGLLFVTVAMCMGAACVSIHKVTKLDPAMVFRL